MPFHMFTVNFHHSLLMYTMVQMINKKQRAHMKQNANQLLAFNNLPNGKRKVISLVAQSV